ncbi:male sterility protein [Colletotrichum truncatum]|uniref:Male sterility protein n=1 Tax=Colletotrichum truncatum TaxID=5467 RepID=A0ACC3ZG46_COLTU|nr:male sterility protein [Colletotrichum truncatum]KAF6801983.1 male sterility protein [Colletotrichum truncatum]
MTGKWSQVSTQASPCTFPNKKEVGIGDIQEPFPKHSLHCNCHGQSHNVVIRSNEERFNSSEMEKIIVGNPEVKTALIVNTPNFKPVLIIEPFTAVQTRKEMVSLIDRIMPQVAKANEATNCTIATYGRIATHLITVSTQDKPFVRAENGVLNKPATITLYTDEIEDLYVNTKETPLHRVPRIDVSSQTALSRSIAKILRGNFNVPYLNSDADFLASGMGPLQIIAAARFITSCVRATNKHYSGISIRARDLYSHPSSYRLAGHILQAAANNKDDDDAGISSQDYKTMDYLYKKMTENLVVAKPGRVEPAKEQQTVILTGSTGNMGCYLLDEMVRNPYIKSIICFNRSNDGGVEKQAKAMEKRGLSHPTESGKVEFFRTNLAQHNMGLSEDILARLLKETDRIVHNAWAVNFNMPLEAFEPHVKGVRNLADFAAAADKRVAMVFVSTIGVTAKWDRSRGPVPEISLRDFSMAAPGYGQSKLVSSMVLEDAVKAGDFPLAIIRVGQIAGPLGNKGVWSRHEWFPSVIASSLVLKALPKHLAGWENRTSWLPVESMSKMILDIGGLTEASRDYHEGYFHGCNPSVTQFDKLAPVIQNYYGKDRLPELVSFKEWVERLEKSRTTEGAPGADRNPALKLVDFLRNVASSGEDESKTRTHDVQRAISCSPSLRSAMPVTPELMIHWCKQWRFEGLSARASHL